MGRGVKIALAAIIGLAGVVRFWGLSYGLPHPLVRPDEEIVVGHSLELSLGTIEHREQFPYPELAYFRDPVRGRPIAPRLGFAYPYPDLVYDIDAALLATWRIAGQGMGEFQSKSDFIDRLGWQTTSTLYEICRGVGAVCGTLTVLAVFGAAWWGYGRRSAGLVAALLVAVNFLHARDSHYATVDVPMTLMVTAALALAMRATASGDRRHVWWSAGFAGLAASAKFNGAAIVLSTVSAAVGRWLPSRSRDDRRWVVSTLAVAAVIMIVVFAVTSPWCLEFYKTVHLGLRIQRRVLFGSVGTRAGVVFLRDTLPNAFGWPAFLLALAGVGRALWLRRRADVAVLAFLLPAFASMAAMTWVLPRYPLPLVPPLAILAAETVDALAIALVPAWAAALVLVALVGAPLGRIVQYDRLASRPDTRDLAANWIAAQVPAGATVAVCRGYGAPVVNVDTRHPPAFQRIDLLPCSAKAIAESGADFVVTHSHSAIPFFEPADDARALLASSAQAIAVFSPFAPVDPEGAASAACFYPGDAFYLPFCRFGGVERGGPVINVWKWTAGRR
jgi:MFS family permease